MTEYYQSIASSDRKKLGLQGPRFFLSLEAMDW